MCRLLLSVAMGLAAPVVSLQSHPVTSATQPTSVAEDIFKVLDRDHNGGVSQGELESAMKGGIISSSLRNFNGSENFPRVVVESYGKRSVGSTSGEVKRVTCIGDSITAGTCGTQGQSYPEQLQELLGDSYNVSKYGAAGRGLLESAYFPVWNEEEFLEEAFASKPDIVVIMFGTNDAKITGFSEDEFKTMYDKMIQMFRALTPSPTVYIMTPPPVYYANMEDHSIVAPNVNEVLCPIIETVATSHGLTLIDNFKSFESKCSDLDATSCYLIAHEEPPALEGIECNNDYVHPSDEGYAMIAQNVFKAIK